MYSPNNLSSLQTISAIVQASHFPVSIIIVGQYMVINWSPPLLPISKMQMVVMYVMIHLIMSEHGGGGGDDDDDDDGRGG